MRKAFIRYFSSFFFLVALLIALAGTPVAFARAYSTQATSRRTAVLSCSGWSIVASLNPSTQSNSLSSVATVSSSNVWAVGYYGKSNNVEQTLIEQWNGTSWSVIASPDIGTSDNILNGVAVVSYSNVWAVGQYRTGRNNYATLIEHWDGASWSVVPSPDVGTSDDLYSVVAVSTSDVWAVGDYYNSSTFSDETLIEQWNGTSWSIVTSPNVSTTNDLYSVTAVSANNVWAVGRYIKNSSGFDQTLIEQWNGTRWSVIASPNLSDFDDLYGVTAVSASDVWTVGYYTSAGFGGKTLIEQWNGSSWSAVSSPNVGPSANYLYSAAAISVSNVVAVGDYFKSSIAADQTLTEHWNGTKWSVVDSPNASSTTNDLFGVAAVSTSDVWAVGYYYSSNGSKTYKTLVEHYC